MESQGYSLTQSKESQNGFVEKQEKIKNKTGVTYWREKMVVGMMLAGTPVEEIAEALGYAGKGSVYTLLRRESVVQHIQEVMDYYDIRFKMLYPEVIDAVQSALQSSDEKVQLKAGEIWLRSHGKMNAGREQKTVETNVENLIANILIQADRRDDTRSISDREPVQDTEQRETRRKFYLEPESKKVRQPKNPA